MADNTVSNLIQRINDISDSSSQQDAAKDPSARAALLQASRELTTALQQPDEVVSMIGYISGGGNMCVRLAIDLDIYGQLAATDRPLTAVQLSKEKGADPSLITRVCRVLAGMGFVTEASTAMGSPAYAPNAVTKHMLKPNVKAGIRFFFDQGFPILAAAPAYFSSNGYQLPTGPSDGPLNYAHNTREDSFTYWSKQPGVMENFNVFMNGIFGAPHRLHWTDWFPFDTVTLNDFDFGRRSQFVWVDVGGGKGHHVQQIINKYPEAKGEYVVQDLPFVIADIEKSGVKLSPRITPMAHDFFEEQPIKGAKTYWMANIIHNWADASCHEILVRLREAMIPAYSKLLVADIVMTDQNVPLRQSGMDLAMLYLHGGGQRSEAEYHRMFEKAGLKICKIWLPPGDGDGIVEAEVPA